MISQHFFVCDKAVRNCRNNQCVRGFESQMGARNMEWCYRRYQKDRSEWDDWG